MSGEKKLAAWSYFFCVESAANESNICLNSGFVISHLPTPGAPGIDGVTFDAIEKSGLEGFLQQIRDEHLSHKCVLAGLLLLSITSVLLGMRAQR